MMNRILETVVVTSGKEVRKGGGDDSICQLNSRITPTLLSALAIAVALRHYVSAPTHCWCPAHFTSSHVKFTNQVCWLTNTYYLDINSQIPKEDEPHSYISYYQWVPLVLVCQAIMFYLPRALWNLLNKRSGVAVHTITDAAVECQGKVTPDDRKPILEYMSNHMGRFLMDAMVKRAETSLWKQVGWWVYGRYLVLVYIFIKGVYFANAIIQLYALNAFLGMDNYHRYGFEVLGNMFNGQNWSTSDRFPRVTLCDMEIRLLGNVHRYAIQCSLPMNLIIEIIFIFIWFWFVFLSAISAISLLHWAWICCWRPGQVEYIHSRIMTMDSFTEGTENVKEKQTREFSIKFLRGDGCFIVRLVSNNTSDTIAAEFLYDLWKYYKKNSANIERVHGEGTKKKHKGKTDTEASENIPLRSPENTSSAALHMKEEKTAEDGQCTTLLRHTHKNLQLHQ